MSPSAPPPSHSPAQPPPPRPASDFTFPVPYNLSFDGACGHAITLFLAFSLCLAVPLAILGWRAYRRMLEKVADGRRRRRRHLDDDDPRTTEKGRGARGATGRWSPIRVTMAMLWTLVYFRQRGLDAQSESLASTGISRCKVCVLLAYTTPTPLAKPSIQPTRRHDAYPQPYRRTVARSHPIHPLHHYTEFGSARAWNEHGCHGLTCVHRASESRAPTP
jgi:hypothetical protein